MVTLKRARPITAVLIGLLGALAALSCGGSSRGENTHPGTAGTGAAGLAASGGEAGSAASGRGGGGSGRGGAAGSIGGTGGSSGSAAGAGATSAAGGTAPLAGRDGSGGTSAGQSAGGSSGESSSGDGGSAGERAIECTGAMPYFPEFDRTCTTDDDCVTVAHQTSCCGSELLMGIRSIEQAAFEAAEATCDQQYPPCGCAAQGVDIEDGTQVPFSSRDQVHASCDAGSCRAHYSGTSFSCGTRRCTEQQYCVQSSGGPVGTPTSYTCNPSACTDCSCITMSGCTCSQTDGHLTVTCEYP